MKLLKTFLLTALLYFPAAWAADPAGLNIKYSSNYLIPAYVHFKSDGFEYTIKANINVPLYNIQFTSKGTQSSDFFNMLSYQDTRNNKPYAEAKIANRKIEYGKVKDGLKTEELTLPTYDLFTVAFQLSYYDKLPNSFQITNGKKLYPMENVVLNTGKKQVKYNKQEVTEITYKFKTGDKDIMVKKYEGEKFPRFISYNRDGDEYELTFSEFVKD
ncbi:transcriptional regulator CysB [Aggregatibacter actinomycetemcomitans serotype e str. SC1083]|uniref:Transcriptional regulator CysB n=1 Tax=Aggregatibacter actinomycetemcomitans serotype e str. SC1083 TaxID=907488 RepID=G4ABC6_AGGAC|nr:hypothetical protein [Aggregatibacter actinomycetemcomitans]EGY32467.1 transcriptional regulator CysB [Aggregatibacter actinomycetemcomitans serotype e str. SC1083]KYK75123.1 membrane protein [Aggregatibacter actinomycetemcomitans serotype e str. SA3096]KYK77955.1 membrane protein [Aggregatibacter actinomycetemcomitans serotype e str. SC936]TYB21392.1 hypothetical protein FXB85_03810 [Aggregatibacter actinomycetemcomitans]